MSAEGCGQQALQSDRAELDTALELSPKYSNSSFQEDECLIHRYIIFILIYTFKWR